MGFVSLSMPRKRKGYECRRGCGFQCLHHSTLKAHESAKCQRHIADARLRENRHRGREGVVSEIDGGGNAVDGDRGDTAADILDRHDGYGLDDSQGGC